jgi:hypothetical protein
MPIAIASLTPRTFASGSILAFLGSDLANLVAGRRFSDKQPIFFTRVRFSLRLVDR